MLLSKTGTAHSERKFTYSSYFRESARINAILLGCLSGLSLLVAVPAASAADAVCAGKAEGYFWSSTESSTAACDATKFQSVCNKTFSNFCFGGNRMAIQIMQSCQQVACAAASTPVVSTPVVATPVVTAPVVTAPVVTAPVVTKPVVTAPVVTAPVVTAPVVTAPVVAFTPGRLMLMGVNGHDAWTVDTYKASQTAAAFKLLAQNNIHTYRVDVSADQRGIDTLTRLLPIAKANNIVLRPMLYVDNVTAATVSDFVARFAKDIRVWELGNELNLRGYDNFASNIALMKIARQGVDSASLKTGIKLETALNVTAWADGKLGLNATSDSYPFVDLAIKNGLAFDIITYHYYPNAADRSSGWMKKYLNPLRKYGKRVFLNETNCGQIYQGDDGNSDACKATADSLLAEVKLNYTDLITEVNMYEMFDNAAAGGVEAHFGLMKDISTPKKTLTLLAGYGANTDATYLPIASAAQTAITTKLTKASVANVNFVTDLYARALGRRPDQSGLDSWTDALEQKRTTKTNLVNAFLTGTEFLNQVAAMDNEAYVSRVYLVTLGRMATQAELIANAKLTNRPALVTTLMATTEFKNRMLSLN